MKKQVITYKKCQLDNVHFKCLRKLVKAKVNILPKKRLLFKPFYAISLILVYLGIYTYSILGVYEAHQFYFLYISLGLVSVLIFINVIHDAVHNNVFKSRKANFYLIHIFDILGGNSYIWKQRHIHFHHNFPNVADWDSDIEQSGYLRIYPHDKTLKVMRYQHYFVFLLYPLYLFNWIFLRDFKDFFQNKRIVKKTVVIPKIEYFKLFFFKLFFVFYLVFIPVMFGYKLKLVLIALGLLLVSASVFALLVLLTPHVNIKCEFPLPDSSGNIHNTWLQHQFITTNDLNLNNWFTRNIMGNFNYHIFHHLFPRISSTYAPEITEFIKEYAKDHGFTYRSYGLIEALSYHYKLVKTNALDINFLEED